MKLNKSFTSGGLIKLARKKRGLNQKELALIVDVHHSAISLWESGRRGITLTNAQKVADGLGMNLSEVFDGPPDDSPIMTLKDYFAANAMQGLISNGTCLEPSGVAKLSYKTANAMLKEREHEVDN